MSNVIITGLALLSILTNAPGPAEIESIDNVDTTVNIVDDNTIGNDDYYMDADDFTIPEDQVSDENIDILSSIIVWDKNTGEILQYESKDINKDSVTYYYDDLQLTVNYELSVGSDFGATELVNIVARAAVENIFGIIIVSITLLALIFIILLLVRKFLNSYFKKIVNLLNK